MRADVKEELSPNFSIARTPAAHDWDVYLRLEGNELTALLDGLVLVRELMTRYWDTMFPPLNRLRARAGMVGWMSDQSGEVVGAIKLKASDAALVKHRAPNTKTSASLRSPSQTATEGRGPSAKQSDPTENSEAIHQVCAETLAEGCSWWRCGTCSVCQECL